MIIITHIIIKKYSVHPIEFVGFFDIGEIMRGAAWCKPLNLTFFGWFVLSHPLYFIAAYRKYIKILHNVAFTFHPIFVS